MIIDSLKLGLKNLRQRGLRSWLTMIGIFIGVATIVALLSLGQGMKDAITGQFSSIGAETITVQAAGGGFGPPGSYVASLITQDDLDEIKKVRGVENAFGRMIESVRVKVDGEQDFGYIVSLPQDNAELKLALTLPTSLDVESGRQLTATDSCKLMIGNNLATKDQLVRKLRLRDKIQINNKDFDIVGILEKTGNPQLDSTLFAPEDCVREVTGVKEKYSLIVAKAESNQDVNDVVANIEKALRKSRHVEEGREDFSVQSSQATLESINSILDAVNWFLVGIAFISIIVGLVGITNTMYTSVLERNKEIGIMKAVGARNSSILTIFLVESGLLGMAGGAIGIGIGLGLSSLVAFMAQASGFELLQANYSPVLIIGALLFSFIFGSLSGVFPAKQAAELPPVEALRRG